MSHNKMHRQIEGYSDALYLASDIVDVVDELKYNLKHGKSVNEVLIEVSNIEKFIGEIRNNIEKGNGKRVNY